MYSQVIARVSADALAVSNKVTLNTLAGPRYPKRKRVQVKYCEIEAGRLSETQSDSEVDEDDCPPPPKMARMTRPGKALPKHKVFPFLYLPPEIRNKIYHECLVSDDLDDHGQPSLYFGASRRRYRHNVRRYTREGEDARTLTANLLATCKAVHAEAAPLLYQHRFIFHDTLALLSFMSEYTPPTSGLLKHIQVNEWLQSRSHMNIGFLAMSILAAKGCVNLQSLKIVGSLGHFHRNSWATEQRSVPMQDRVAKKVYREFYPWLEAAGKASGKMFKGLDVLDIGEATWNYAPAYGKTRNEEDREGEKAMLKAAYIKALKKLIRENWT